MALNQYLQDTTFQIKITSQFDNREKSEFFALYNPHMHIVFKVDCITPITTTVKKMNILNQ